MLGMRIPAVSILTFTSRCDMNERIRELIEQATTIEEHGWGASYENFDREKFAELIVQECIDLMQGFTFEELVVKVIKARFGVKE